MARYSWKIVGASVLFVIGSSYALSTVGTKAATSGVTSIETAPTMTLEVTRYDGGRHTDPVRYKWSDGVECIKINSGVDCNWPEKR